MENEQPDSILNEIFERAQDPAPPPQRPVFEYPAEDDPPPSLSGTVPEKNRAASTKIPLWLSAGLGAILLVLGLCVLQLARVGQRLDAIQEDMSGELGSVEQLRSENQSLQASRELLRERVQKAETGTENLRRQMETLDESLQARVYQVMALNNFWYVHQFVDHGDYAMAALAAQKGHYYYTFATNRDIALSPAIVEQFEQNCQMLIQQGYLQEWPGAGLYINRQERFQDEEETDTLTALWDVLDSYYCFAYSDDAADTYGYIPIRYFDAFGGAEYTFIREHCSAFTLQLYQQMIESMVDGGQLNWEDGRLTTGTGSDFVYGTLEEGGTSTNQ